MCDGELSLGYIRVLNKCLGNIRDILYEMNVSVSYPQLISKNFEEVSDVVRLLKAGECIQNWYSSILLDTDNANIKQWYNVLYSAAILKLSHSSYNVTHYRDAVRLVLNYMRYELELPVNTLSDDDDDNGPFDIEIATTMLNMVDEVELIPEMSDDLKNISSRMFFYRHEYDMVD